MALFERNSQNPKIMKKLCDEWEKEGHNIIKFWPCSSKNKFKEMEKNEKNHVFLFSRYEEYIEFLKKINENKRSFCGLIKLFITHPFLGIKFVLMRFNIFRGLFDESNIIKKEVEFVCKQRKIDIIVAGSNPLFLPLGMAKAKCKCRKIWYQMDPHSENGMIQKNIKNEKKKDHFIYDSVDKIYVQENALKTIKQSEFACYLNKISPLFFPLIEKKVDGLPEYGFFEEGTINCVFAGALMIPIRRPEYMLRLFAAIKEKRIRLYIWSGNLTNDMEDELKSLLPSNVRYCGSLLQDEMKKVLLGADVLVNLGNSVSNQFPSKILDYISLKKPIINIYKINDCPTLKILKSYPLVLNICEDDDILQKSDQMENFIISSAGMRVDDEVIIDNYAKYFPENAARFILE